MSAADPVNERAISAQPLLKFRKLCSVTLVVFIFFNWLVLVCELRLDRRQGKTISARGWPFVIVQFNERFQGPLLGSAPRFRSSGVAGDSPFDWLAALIDGLWILGWTMGAGWGLKRVPGIGVRQLTIAGLLLLAASVAATLTFAFSEQTILHAMAWLLGLTESQPVGGITRQWWYLRPLGYVAYGLSLFCLLELFWQRLSAPLLWRRARDA